LGVERPEWDPKTGLFFENSETRRALMSRFSQSIRDGKHCATLQGDLDQLNAINSGFGRKVGDIGLAWTATTLTKNIQAAGLAPDTKWFILRKKSTGDEMIAWFFDVDPADQDKITKINADLNKLKEKDESGATFSVSTGVTQTGEFFVEQEAEVQKLLREGSLETASNLFHEFEARADADAMFAKYAKQLDEFGETDILQERNVRELNNIIAREYGGGRVTPTILKLLLMTSQVSATLTTLEKTLGPQNYAAKLQELGIDPEAGMHDTHDLSRVFNKLFPSDRSTGQSKL